MSPSESELYPPPAPKSSLFIGTRSTLSDGSCNQRSLAGGRRTYLLLLTGSSSIALLSPIFSAVSGNSTTKNVAPFPSCAEEGIELPDYILIRKEIPVVLGLTNLAQLPRQFTFAAFLRRIEGGEGSPVRAVALVPYIQSIRNLLILY